MNSFEAVFQRMVSLASAEIFSLVDLLQGRHLRGVGPGARLRLGKGRKYHECHRHLQVGSLHADRRLQSEIDRLVLRDERTRPATSRIGSTASSISMPSRYSAAGSRSDRVYRDGLARVPPPGWGCTGGSCATDRRKSNNRLPGVLKSEIDIFIGVVLSAPSEAARRPAGRRRSRSSRPGCVRHSTAGSDLLARPIDGWIHNHGVRDRSAKNRRALHFRNCNAVSFLLKR